MKPVVTLIWLFYLFSKCSISMTQQVAGGRGSVDSSAEKPVLSSEGSSSLPHIFAWLIQYHTRTHPHYLLYWLLHLMFLCLYCVNIMLLVQIKCLFICPQPAALEPGLTIISNQRKTSLEIHSGCCQLHKYIFMSRTKIPRFIACMITVPQPCLKVSWQITDRLQSGDTSHLFTDVTHGK